MRQQLVGHGEEPGEQAGGEQGDGPERKERPSVTDERQEEALLIIDRTQQRAIHK